MPHLVGYDLLQCTNFLHSCSGEVEHFHDGAFMGEVRPVGRLWVRLMSAAIVGVFVLSGWLLWPEWRKFQAVRRLSRDFEGLRINCDHDVKLHPDAYAAATDRGREVKKVGGEALATEFLLPMLKHDCAKVRMHAAVFIEQLGPAASAIALRRIDPKSATEFAREHVDDGQLSPKVLDILMHYDHEKALEGKKLAF